MWAVANYVNSLTGMRKSQLEKVRDACRDALAGLPHDHCAKYLVHRLLEAYALLGDDKRTLQTWKEQRSYLDGKLAQGEWFSARRKYLLTEAIALGRSLEDNHQKIYRRVVRGLRWRVFVEQLHFSGSGGGVRTTARWWWLIWLLLLLLRALFQNPR